MKYNKISILPWSNNKFKIDCYSRNGRRIKIVYTTKNNLESTIEKLRSELQ